MDCYDMWFNLKDSREDLAFADACAAYLGRLQSKGVIASWRLTRRKFGFGPPSLGEFHVRVEVIDLAQLDAAFGVVAARAGEIESVHHAVYSRVKDFTSALFRDFPDPQRVR